MATNTTIRRQRARKPTRRHLVVAFAEHWLLAFAAHVTATVVLVVVFHVLQIASCG